MQTDAGQGTLLRVCQDCHQQTRQHLTPGAADGEPITAVPVRVAILVTSWTTQRAHATSTARVGTSTTLNIKHCPCHCWLGTAALLLLVYQTRDQTPTVESFIGAAPGLPSQQLVPYYCSYAYRTLPLVLARRQLDKWHSGRSRSRDKGPLAWFWRAGCVVGPLLMVSWSYSYQVSYEYGT